VHFVLLSLIDLLICFSKFAVRRWRYYMLSESSCYVQCGTCTLSRCAVIPRICAQPPGTILFWVQLNAICMDRCDKKLSPPNIQLYYVWFSAPSSSVHACTYLYVCNQCTMCFSLCFYCKMLASYLISNSCILGCSLSISW